MNTEDIDADDTNQDLLNNNNGTNESNTDQTQKTNVYSALETQANDEAIVVTNDSSVIAQNNEPQFTKGQSITNLITNENNSINTKQFTFIEAVIDVFKSFWALGFVAFGGPTAHVAILHERFVERKKWLDEERFLELLAVGQGLPGPTSTQMVISIGAYRAGLLGGLLSFLFWNLPSFIILTLSGLGVSNIIGKNEPYWMSGLPAAAVSLVFVAAFKLSKKVIDSKLKIALCIISAVTVLLLIGDARVSAREQAIAFPILIFGGGLFTILDSNIPKRAHIYDKLRNESNKERIIQTLPYMNKYTSIALVLAWLIVLLVFVILRINDGLNDGIAELFESFFRIGSIIYGGGQVVLPMLLSEVVDPGWVTPHQFWTGFAIVQALPGPLFNFSAYLGAVAFGMSGAIVGWLGLFGPGLLLIFAFLPLWDYVHSIQWFRIFLQGVNATAIGLVIAACVVLWHSAIDNYSQSCVAIITASMVALFNVPAPIAIILGGIIGWILCPQALNIGQSPVCT